MVNVQKFVGCVVLALGVGANALPLPALSADLASTATYWLPVTPEHAREVLDYDGKSRVIKDTILPAWGSNKGLKITAYFPGTKSVRMKAYGDWYSTVATYYRPDHTRDCVLRMFNGMVFADGYDATGAKLITSQVWFKRTRRDAYSEQNTYVLWDVRQMDGADKPLQEYMFDTNTELVTTFTRYNVKVPGDSVYFHYADDGRLDFKIYNPPHQFAGGREAPGPGDDLSAPPIPDALLQVPAHLNEDVFPEIPDMREYR
ncbi:MAG TPA: hypothetical protein V6C89_15005 [Drouetiella sp.]